MRRLLIAAALLATTPALAADAWSRSYPLHMGTHVLTVTGRTGSARLLLDGKTVADASSFPLDLQATVDGVPTAAVYADRGGASCEDGTLLLFAAPTGKAVVTGKVPATSCQARPKAALANGEVVVVDPPVAAKPRDATPAVAASPGSVTLFDARHGAARAMGLGPEGPDQE